MQRENENPSLMVSDTCHVNTLSNLEINTNANKIIATTLLCPLLFKSSLMTEFQTCACIIQQMQHMLALQQVVSLGSQI